jgi:uncharacterized membrane-anchored protein
MATVAELFRAHQARLEALEKNVQALHSWVKEADEKINRMMATCRAVDEKVKQLAGLIAMGNALGSNPQMKPEVRFDNPANFKPMEVEEIPDFDGLIS